MEKINVVLVVLNPKVLENTLANLNFDNVNLVAIVIENGNGKFIELGANKVLVISFNAIQMLLAQGENFLWLLSGIVNGVGDTLKMKNFLTDCGVPENNIINFELISHLSTDWIKNLRCVENHGADFFATGNSCTEFGLYLKNIPCIGGGVNLADSNQDLLQSYLTAKYIFEHVKPGTIKFVLIGLSPYSFHYDNAKDFSAYPHNLQYMLALNAPAQNQHDRLLQALVSDNVKNIFAPYNLKQANLNSERRNTKNLELSVKSLINWKIEQDNLTAQFRPQAVEQNLQILKEYIKLCLENGAKPVGVVFPFSPIVRQNYSEEILTIFRLMIRQLEESYDFTCVDMFNLRLSYDCFFDAVNLNRNGAATASTFVAFNLYEKNLVGFEELCGMNYNFFNNLSYLIPKEKYNEFLDRVLARTVNQLRKKKKIKVGFLAENAANWCGDKLYNYFAKNKRFEPTIFLCMREDDRNEEIEKDFRHGLEQFKARKLNVVGLDGRDAKVPTQDIMFFLKPYLGSFPVDAVQFSSLTPQTLLAYIPYGFNSSTIDNFNNPIIRVIWKFFFETIPMLELFDEKCTVGMPRGVFSGYPRLDVLFEDKLSFDWKMARPDAKKIIWAPHWSIDRGITFATFQWNYKFMYEFAKAHPEISWILKPHPKLAFTAVDTGLFPSIEAYQEYIQKWNALPNAKVYTGAYYHSVFATSDGIILDSCSFIAEYQYTHKPTIFLTRNTQEFTKFGNELMEVLYRVDGRDLKGIAALMQEVFIEGKDPMFDARMNFFDKYLNYPKYNGVSASEFIYRNILNEIEGRRP